MHFGDHLPAAIRFSKLTAARQLRALRLHHGEPLADAVIINHQQ